MGILNVNDTAMVVIDVQEKLLNSVFNKEQCAKHATIMANVADILEIPTVVTEQYPKGLGNTIEPIKGVLDKAHFYEKITFSALENPEVIETIKATGRKQILVYGIETHICVSQTANALIEAGFEVNIIKDACGSRAEVEYLAGLERMKDNGAHIITTEIALFELLRGAKHPKFKEVQALIK